MTRLIERSTRLLVQGITGREARMVTRHMLDYGTSVVSGVTPGRGGQDVEGVPVFDTIRQAVTATQPSASLVSVPPAATLDAVSEAIAGGIPLIVIATEGIPQHDVMRMLELADQHETVIIGPNSVGVIRPADGVKIGAIGGENPERAFVPGRIGVISRSGGMTSEIGLTLRQAGLGVSAAISVGGDALIGSTPATLLAEFQSDSDTDAVVLFGEPGTRFEEDVAHRISSGEFSKPMVTLIAGEFTESLPAGTAFGHAAAIIEGDSGRPSSKRAALEAAGARVARSLDEIPGLLETAG
ncbi:MAG: succinate--CoA ligase subunit alpha [Sphaerobacteraceae bacterium]|nr:MAG: succinate--CoA ligase subunit alpha [Sphaerobacteraceae bacterium]